MVNKLKTLTVKLPEKWVDHLNHLEQTTSKNKEYYIKEALFRQLEDIEDYQIAVERSKSKSRTYSGEEVDKRLRELKFSFSRTTNVKNLIRQQLVAGYKRQAKNEKLQKDLAIWDTISGDGL